MGPLQDAVQRALPAFSRLLIALLFLVAGVRKLTAFSGTTLYFAKLGLPAPELVAAAVIAVELIGATLLILGWRVRLVALVFCVFSVAAGLIAHQFWSAEPAQFGNQLNHFLKNVALSGALLWVALPRA